MAPAPIRIVRTEVFSSRTSLRPFRSVYSLAEPVPNAAGILVNYSGAPLAEIRRIAKRLADERGTTVVETWKREG